MKRKVFTKEFKLEAVRLLESSGRAAAEVARGRGSAGATNGGLASAC